MTPSAIRFRITAADAGLTDCLARLPFRFGIVTMHGAPLCVLQVTIETPGGEQQHGFASDLLVPKWFEKDPQRTMSQSWQALIDGIIGACDAALSDENASAFDHWHRLYENRVGAWSGARAWRLLLGHGVALVERAMIDAICRLTKRPFHAALREGLTGAPDAWCQTLAPPRDRVAIRHTVGLLDPLDDADQRPEVNDELPVTLAEAIRAGGLTHFKLKVCGDISADVQRLRRVATVLQRECAGSGRKAVLTLDGNEQFESILQLREFVSELRAAPATEWLLERTVSIEQPLARARTFEPESNVGLCELSESVPLIIDEADLDIAAFDDAVALGYRGVSVKNCKGVFRALRNAARCRASDGVLFQSAEDLTNIPALALQQDLATITTLGLTHVERNGHHYFRGLAHLPAAECEAALARHDDLYRDAASGVRISNGAVRLGSVHRACGYGYDGPVDLAIRTPIREWTPDALLAMIPPSH